MENIISLIEIYVSQKFNEIFGQDPTGNFSQSSGAFFCPQGKILIHASSLRMEFNLFFFGY